MCFDTASVTQRNQVTIVASLKCTLAKGISRCAQDFGKKQSLRRSGGLNQNLRPYCLASAAFDAAALPASDFAYFRRKRSTRPAVSTSFCLPVKNGWQFEQISRLMAPLWVDRVVNVFPHAQCTRTSSYLGWIAAFIASDTFRGKALFYLKLADFG
jgi:hypothetical protein